MIISRNGLNTTPRWVYAGVLLAALAVLPLGVAFAQAEDPGIEERFNRIGVSDETVARIESHLREQGIADERLDEIMDGLFRVTQELQAEGEAFELDPGLRSDLWATGLTDEQIDLLPRLARSIVAGLEKHAQEDEGLVGHYERIGVSREKLGWIKKHLVENGIAGDQIEGVLGGMLRIIHEMKAEGEDFELNSRLRSYFEDSLRLTYEQVDMVQGLARRMLAGLQKTRAAGDFDAEVREAMLKVRQAVASGELTEEEGRAKVEAIKKKAAAEKRMKADHEAIWAKLRAMVESGELTAEQAEAKMTAIREESRGD